MIFWIPAVAGMTRERAKGGDDFGETRDLEIIASFTLDFQLRGEYKKTRRL